MSLSKPCLDPLDNRQAKLRCVNRYCPNGNGLIKAFQFVCAYYHVSYTSEKEVCSRCFRKCMNHYTNLYNKWNNGECLFKDVNYPVYDSRLVIDSSSDYDESKQQSSTSRNMLPTFVDLAFDFFIQNNKTLVDVHYNMCDQYIKEETQRCVTESNGIDNLIKSIEDNLNIMKVNLSLPVTSTNDISDNIQIPIRGNDNNYVNTDENDNQEDKTNTNLDSIQIPIRGNDNYVSTDENDNQEDKTNTNLDNIQIPLRGNDNNYVNTDENDNLEDKTTGKEDFIIGNSNLPKKGPLQYPFLEVGQVVYAKQLPKEPWIKCKILSTIDIDNVLVKFDFEEKVIARKNIAYGQLNPVQYPVGSRVIAKFSIIKRKCVINYFYAGIVGESPTLYNNYRYLIFFDNSNAQYKHHKDIRLVIYNFKQLWKDPDLDISFRQFIISYLQKYPDFEMVNIVNNDFILAECKNQWIQAIVLEIDASIVKLYFRNSKQSEWLYRGSPRLSPIFEKLLNKSINCDELITIGNLNDKNKMSKPVKNSKEEDKLAKPVQKSNEEDILDKPGKNLNEVIRYKPVQNSNEEDKLAKLVKNSNEEDKLAKPVQKSNEEDILDKPGKNLHEDRKRSKPVKNLNEEDKLAKPVKNSNEEDKLAKPIKNLNEVIRSKPVQNSNEEDKLAKPVQKSNEEDILDKPVLRSSERRKRSKTVQISNKSSKRFKPIEKEITIKPVVPNVAHIGTVKEVNKNATKVGDQTERMSKDNTDIILKILPKHVSKPKHFGVHTCNYSCIEWTKYSYNRAKTINMLAIPLHFGFKRIVDNSTIKYKSLNADVIYIAPCGIIIQDIKEMYDYLILTNSEMTIDQFNFSSKIQPMASLRNLRYKIKLEDLSKGIESRPILCFNEINEKLPSPINYITNRQAMPGVNMNADGNFLCGCDCTDNCQDKSKCACWQLTTDGLQVLPFLNNVPTGYNYHKLSEPILTGIYECNKTCKCNSNCLNRVVQQPLSQILQLFLTEKKGWGVRCQNDVPKGSFICIFVGNVYTETDATEEGKLHGDEYLADLDFMEVIDQTKEDYEYNVFEASSTWNINHSPDTSLKLNSEKEKQHTLNLHEHNVENLFEPRSSTRQLLYGKNESVYIIDANAYGNIGRYFNHSCNPNTFIQNVFVDTHDIRFPWISIFAKYNIKAGTELTWDYNYQIGSVPGKVLKCCCESKKCRGRLL